jgi:hypothetical protein
MGRRRKKGSIVERYALATRERGEWTLGEALAAERAGREIPRSVRLPLAKMRRLTANALRYLRQSGIDEFCRLYSSDDLDGAAAHAWTRLPRTARARMLRDGEQRGLDLDELEVVTRIVRSARNSVERGRGLLGPGVAVGHVFRYIDRSVRESVYFFSRPRRRPPLEDSLPDRDLSDSQSILSLPSPDEGLTDEQRDELRRDLQIVLDAAIRETNSRVKLPIFRELYQLLKADADVTFRDVMHAVEADPTRRKDAAREVREDLRSRLSVLGYPAKLA